MNDITELLEAIKQDTKVSNRQLETELKIPRHYISKLRSGDRIPRSVGEQICKALGIKFFDYFNAACMPLTTDAERREP